MSEFDRILMQNANLTLGIISLIETLDRSIKDLQTKYTYKDKDIDIRTYKNLKQYLEEVLQLSYLGKSFEDRKKFYEWEKVFKEREKFFKEWKNFQNN